MSYVKGIVCYCAAFWLGGGHLTYISFSLFLPFTLSFFLSSSFLNPLPAPHHIWKSILLRSAWATRTHTCMLPCLVRTIIKERLPSFCTWLLYCCWLAVIPWPPCKNSWISLKFNLSWYHLCWLWVETASGGALAAWLTRDLGWNALSTLKWPMTKFLSVPTSWALCSPSHPHGKLSKGPY